MWKPKSVSARQLFILIVEETSHEILMIVYNFLGRPTIVISVSSDFHLVLLKAGIRNTLTVKCRYTFVFISE